MLLLAQPGRIAALYSVLLLLPPLPAQAPAKKAPLTIDWIMRGPELVGYEPRDVRWSADSQRVYFAWKQHKDRRDRDFDTYVVNRDGSGLKKLSEEEAKQVPPPHGDHSKDRRRVIYERDGTVYLYDHAAQRRTTLLDTVEPETDPHFLRGDKRVAFTRGTNLFVLALDSPAITQLTDIRPPGADTGEPKKGTESQEYLKREERELIEAVKERARKRDEDEARKKQESPRKPFVLPARHTVASLRLTPDEQFVTALIKVEGEDAKKPLVPSYVTESAYAETAPAREKVGERLPPPRLALVTVRTGEWKWVDHGQKERPVEMSQPVWSEDGKSAVLIARASDNKDRWILALDPGTGQTRVLATDHDDAWIGGPGDELLGWLRGDREIYFQSERTGHSHLYSVPFAGGTPRALTSGTWEVLAAELSPDKARFDLVTNEAGPAEQHLAVLFTETGERRKVTTVAGRHAPVVSPDGQSLADVRSYTNRPPELYLSALEKDAGAVRVTHSPAPEFYAQEWLDVPIVSFAARDGAQVQARLYKPAKFARNGPAVIFVHGAGYLQNVHRWWSHYFREYLFHHFLVEQGYLVLDVDYRGSAGYGRDWRTGIYRHMGGKDLDDQIDAARWLVKQHGVDARRIGIYGGSYGGFITLMAMFTQPEVFAAGAALRPVTDWAHYNHPYTSNILNTPQQDAEAFKKSSPLYFAEGLKGALLICHGMVDVNVHFQDSVRLAQRLIELRKENWELAAYPVEDHAFVQPTSWADEYKRIFKLFELNLKKTLPGAGRGRS